MNPNFALLFVLQTTSYSTTSQNVMMISLALLLVLGWAIAIALTVLGSVRRVQRVFSYGFLAIGLMTILTPYSIYVDETIVMGGTFPATVWDFTILTFFSALGGAVITVSRFWQWKKTSHSMPPTAD